jgi:hypothetical protein
VTPDFSWSLLADRRNEWFSPLVPCRPSMPHLADPSRSRHERPFGNDPGGLVPTGSWTDGP